MRLNNLFIAISLFLTFSLSAQEDYYWIGGTGIWADLTNWETSTGSTPSEVPDAEDNVIFNEFSFIQPNDTVWIMTKNPQCKNMIWENLSMPVAMAGGADSTILSIYASLTFHDQMSNAYNGPIQFLSNNAGNTVTSVGNRYLKDVYFDGDGEWILQDTLLVFDTTNWMERVADPLMENPDPNPEVYLQKGTLDFNGQPMISEGFSATKQNTRHLIIENSNVYILDGSWSVNASGLTLDAEGSLITCRGGISNTTGDGENLVYNDAVILALDGFFTANEIMVEFRKVIFEGACSIEGENGEGGEGSYTIDTLIVYGAPCIFTAPLNNIHYALFMGPTGMEIRDSYIHHLEFNMGCKFVGQDNNIDSMFVYQDDAIVAGWNNIDYGYYETDASIIGSEGKQNMFDHAVFAGDGFFLGNNTFDKLSLNSGFWYRFKADSLAQGGYNTSTFVQTITSELEVIGGCSGGVTTLSSDYQTVQAYLNYQGPGITTEYLAVKDIKNIGSSLTIDYGVDLLNNDNITFNTLLPARDLFWIGGAGNWSDQAHWATSSGGGGGNCPPSPVDNIFFDGGSGLDGSQEVNIDVKYVQGNDMTWAGIGSPVLSGAFSALEGVDTNSIKLWGSLEYAEDMDVQFTGDYYFVSEFDTDYETITLSGQSLDFAAIHFDGEEGKWMLMDELNNTKDTLFFRMGELHTNKQEVHVYNFYAGDTLDRILNIEESIISVHQPLADAWTLGGYKVEFFSNLSLIQSIGDGDLPFVPPALCNVNSPGANELEYYDIEFYAEESQLMSPGLCIYHDVTYKPDAKKGKCVGEAEINILTFEEGADECTVENTHTIQLVEAFSLNDTIKGGVHTVYEANFYQPGVVYGYNWVGNLTFHEFGVVDMQNEVDYVKFHQNGHVKGNNIFGTFVTEPGKKYFFQQDELTTITNYFDVNGTCIAPIRLQSDSIGTQAFIEVQYDNVEIDYASFRDLVAMEYNGTGNIPYIADNSVDLGNNVNWELTNQDNNILYWIGGTGDWGDGNNWSHESGGPPLGCLPRELNTVVFDELSFTGPDDTVTLDVKNGLCFSMLWIHSDAFQPVFAGDEGNDLFIYGNLEFSKTMDNQFAGKVFFDELYVEPGTSSDPSTITSNGQVFQNDIRFQGIDGTWILQDSLTMLVSVPDGIFMNIILEHGHIQTNGQKVYTASFFSTYKNDRILDITDSEFVLNVENDYSWLVDGENLTLTSDGSTIINLGNFSYLRSMNGNYLKYNDVYLIGTKDTLVNAFNIVEYNVIKLDGGGDMLEGNYIADSVLINGPGSAMFDNSITNVVIINANAGAIFNTHDINRLFVYKYGKVNGYNNIEYAIFYSDGAFWGGNVFDTLILLPGQGNTFYFEELQIQTVTNKLQIRGHQCQNIDIKSMNDFIPAYIKKDEGIISCDFLNIWNVETIGDNSEFYAGLNSTPHPEPPNEPAGWIWDNAQGYIYGFGDGTDSFCEGEEYVINASNFNGDEFTMYYWDYSTLPGEQTYTVNSAGKYHIRVEYSDDCFFQDDLILSMEYPPEVEIDPGPYCEGETIRISVNPGNGDYNYEWFTGETTNEIVTQLDYNDEDVWLKVLDNSNTCSDSTNNDILVLATPFPEDFLGDDLMIEYGDVITLDAGPGDTWSWSVDDPLIVIDNPDQQYINTSGTLDTLVYSVIVNLITDGFACEGTGEVKVGMFPLGICDLPNAFSPNGDGANDMLLLEGNGIQDLTFHVFNRYGKLVFETTNSNIGWDGTYKGAKQEEDVYTYYLKAIYWDGGVVEKKGNITLLR